MKNVIRLNPTPLIWYFFAQSECYRGTGRYEEAIEVLKKALRRHLDHPTTIKYLALSYSAMSQEKDARATSAEVLRIDLDFSIER